MCGKAARTVRMGGGRKRAHGEDQTGTKPETADTAKSKPKEHRAGLRPSLYFNIDPGWDKGTRGQILLRQGKPWEGGSMM